MLRQGKTPRPRFRGGGASVRGRNLHRELRSVIYAARQLGHNARYTLGTYGHVIDELDDQPQLSAEDAIAAARAADVRATIAR
jgi:hypothetical protein